ncbi:MAG: hypothetical protein FWE06_02405 [Oscillospiraceae bacterium]|nr:hypothetical protein [Oscillospiraceae bacterium]
MYNHRIQTGIRFEEDMHIKITKIAKRNRRSLNAQLEFLAEKCIDEFEREHGEILISEDERGLP